ncbi:Dot/Icm T4SS effector [Legionella geestiana]|uniref:Dot/Icm T4SS effector n=1 Tax=Legionella geestiana TaxID=45065 RepID=A0A0W0U4J4_9GAMM|nr:DUF5621 domain-containing protein [Legionella geestiana]KTD02673.1 Dot/Icm T4SS effector [Legionella geestiana]QBS12731.1 hypothetical protein E4T54_08225 [Legionella geestiana]STX54801.1 Dot/Icm T4SS effector [Legionella geestiana]
MTGHIACLSFMGTAQHREKNMDTINMFHESMGTAAVLGKRLFDGPGSTPLTPNSEHPTPGTYVYDAGKNTKIVNPAAAESLRNTLQAIDGQLTGDGVDNLLLEATLYIEKLKQDNPGLDTVNLQGFSRGADACVRMANVLNRLYPELKVNLFLIDPVPGPGRRDDPDSWHIPPNVNRMEAALMLHEYRPGFDPQHAGRYVIANPETTRVTMMPWYGKHSAGMQLDEREQLNQAPKLIMARYLDFCRETGSIGKEVTPTICRLNRKGIYEAVSHPENLLPKTPEERLQLYNEMRENEWVYARGKRLNPRTVLAQHGDYVKDPELFVNQEHRGLFKEHYPKTFSWFFEGNHKKATEEEVRKELHHLEAGYRDRFLRHFSKHPDPENQPHLPPPRGIAGGGDPVPIGMPQNASDFERLRQNLQSKVNAYHYHCKDKTPENDRAFAKISNSLNAVRTQTPVEGLRTLENCMKEINGPELLGARYFRTTPIARKTHAQELAEKLEGYMKSNRFWSGVGSVLNSIGLPCPAFISPEKEAIAKTLAKEARGLDYNNKGDDPQALQKLLQGGGARLKALYEDHPELGIFKSRIDRILSESHSKLHATQKLPEPTAGSTPQFMAN